MKTYFYTSKGILKAVDGVNLWVDKGEAVGLVGESGCGKSTLALSIMRLVPSPGKIIDGTILFNDKNLMELKEKEMRSLRGKKISMIFQDPISYLNPIMKVGNQIAEAIKLHQNVDKGEAKRGVIEALKAVGIQEPLEVAKYYPHQLSGGMTQRILIAMAISCSPSLIIADEPTSSLDVTVQAQVLKLIKSLLKRIDSSLLLITHDLGIVAEFCDRVYVMYAGKIIEYADVYTLYEKPKHPYTKGLIESVLTIDDFTETFTAIKGTVPDMINPPSGCRFHPRCLQVSPICHEQEPPLIEIGAENAVSCWLYG